MRNLIHLLMAALVIIGLTGFVKFNWPFYLIIPICLAIGILDYYYQQAESKDRTRKISNIIANREAQPLADRLPPEFAITAKSVERAFAEIEGIDL